MCYMVVRHYTAVSIHTQDDFRTISWKPSRAAEVWRMLRQMRSLPGSCKGWKLLAATTDGNHWALPQLYSHIYSHYIMVYQVSMSLCSCLLFITESS